MLWLEVELEDPGRSLWSNAVYSAFASRSGRSQARAVARNFEYPPGLRRGILCFCGARRGIRLLLIQDGGDVALLARRRRHGGGLGPRRAGEHRRQRYGDQEAANPTHGLLFVPPRRALQGHKIPRRSPGGYSKLRATAGVEIAPTWT